MKNTIVPASQQCEQLLLMSASSERDHLLDEAAQQTECVEYALEKARSSTNGMPAEALVWSDLAIEISKRGTDLRISASAWRVRGQALRAMGWHAEALLAFESATLCAQQAGDSCLAAQVQLGRIDSLGMLGRYDEAIALARQLEEDLLAEGAEEDAAKALMNAGNLHYRRDQYAAALDCYQRAGKVLAKYGDVVAEARVQTNCANILTRLNRVEEAIPLYEHARAVFIENGMPQVAAMVDANVGFLRYVLGRYSAALASLNRARQEFAARGQSLEMAKCDVDMADVYRALNLYPESLRCYEQAIRMFETIPLDYERARSELGRSAVLMAIGRREEAATALERADIVFRAQKNSLQCAQVRLRRAFLLRSAGQTADAKKEAQAAANVLSRNGLFDWAAEARFILADIALQENGDATRDMQAVVRAARRHACGWLECRAERSLGLYYARQGKIGRALRHLRAAAAALEEARTLVPPEEMHVAFLHDKLTIYEDLVGVLLSRGTPQSVAEAMEYVERSKSRLLFERVQSALEGRSLVPTMATAAHERLGTLRAELSRAYHRAHTFDENSHRFPYRHVGGETQSLVKLEQAYRVALREIELAAFESAPTVSHLPSVFPIDSLQAALRSDENLVEFYVVNGTVCAFVLSKDEVRVLPEIASLDDVSHASRRLRYHLQKIGIGTDYAECHMEELHVGIQDVLRQLYDLLLKPLDPLLSSEKIVLVPHGILHGLPFHALCDGNQYALDRWEFVYAPSAAFWYAGVRRSEREARPCGIDPNHSALLVAVPGPGIERVAVEVEKLAQILPQAHVLCAEEATLSDFRVHAGRSEVIHLATHALFRADNPLFSGLRFADGWLLARDLYEIPLDCRLATLSACRTGMADVEPGDELFGLLRGFLAAGVRSLAASLWPADDVATAELMVHFYSLLTQGVSKATALRAAQRKTRSEHPHPYHWAAFALVGER